jgi:hypothetical protein
MIAELIRPQLEISDHVWGSDPRLDRHQRHHPRDRGIRSLSIHSAQSRLSCLAAVQAPIIMMSQNRAEARRPIAGGK